MDIAVNLAAIDVDKGVACHRTGRRAVLAVSSGVHTTTGTEDIATVDPFGGIGEGVKIG